MIWTSTNGVVLRDLVPAELRARWVEQGHCPDRDLYSLFHAHVLARPTRPAVIDGQGTLDYVHLDLRVRRVASALAALGLGHRDIIGIQVPNGRDAVVAELAVAAIGAVALPYPAGRGTRDSRSLLGRSRASAVVVGDAALAAQLTGAALPELREVLVFGSAPRGCRSLDDVPFDRDFSPARVDPSSPARILVSSGSEAEPKMVVYSHHAMAGGRGNYLRAVHGGASDVRDLVLVPLASSFGSFGTPVTIARLGATLLLPGPFDPATAARMIAEHRPTHVFGVPTMLRRLADLPGHRSDSVRAVVSSGAELPAVTERACRESFGCPVLSVYGSTDGVNCHTGNGSIGVGRPDPAVAEIRILDGEICALGPMTPLCYVADDELDNRYRLPGGWVRTGDRGRLDEQGNLHVDGRIKQVVIRGGYTISPAEVERELSAHPAVADAACVAVPDQELGERLCACVAPRPGTTTTLAELTRFLEQDRGLERRKLPEVLVVLPRLPLGPTGKVCRRTLTELATGGCPS